MEASVIWERDLSFTGRAASGDLLPMASSSDKVGGFSPMELVLLGLAGCTAMDVIAILGKKGERVAGFEVRVRAERARAHPRVFTRSTLLYRLRGDGLDRAAVEQAIELSTTKYCSVHAMLGPTVAIDHSYELLEAKA
jgi:putative redox protein